MPKERVPGDQGTTAAVTAEWAWRKQELPQWGKCGLALVLVAAATMLRLVMDPWMGREGVPYITFNAAVVVTAFLWGRGPGLVATLGSALASKYFIMMPRNSLLFDATADLAPWGIFIVTGLLVSVLAGHLHRVRRLAERQRQLSVVTLASIGDAVIVTDVQGRVTYLNPEAERLTGWSNEQARGEPMASVFHIVNERTREVVESPVAKVLRAGKVVGLANHTVLLARDGREIPIDDSGAPIHQEDGAMAGVVLVFRDITQRKATEEALRESERLYRAIGESIDYGIWVCDAQGRNTYASESFLKLVGLTQEQCANLGWGDVLHPDDVAATLAAWKQCVETGGPWYREHRYRGADGQWHPILACGVAVRDERGEVKAWAGINLDSSRMKRTEEALRESEAQLRLALDAGRMALWDWDIPTGNVKWNDEHYRMLGYEPGTFAPSYQHWIARVHPDDRVVAEAKIRQSMTEGGEYTNEFRTLWPDGTERWLEARGRFDYDGGGKAVRNYGVMLDITRRKRMEEELRAASQRLTYHVDNSPLAVIEWGADMRLTRWSGEAERLFGWKAEEVLGKRIEDFRWVFQEDVPQVAEVMAELTTGRDPQRFSSNRNYRKDGSIVHCEWYNSSLLDGAGKLVSILSLVLDVTDRKRAEEEIQKLAAVVRHSREFIGVATLDGKMVFINQAGAAMVGLAADKVAQTHILEVVPARIQERVKTEVLPTLMKQGYWEGELQYQNQQTGRLIEVYATTFVVKDPETGVPLYLANTSIDITERKQREEDLRRLNRTLKALSSSSQALMCADDETEYLAEVCRIVVEECGHAMVWIGYAEQDEAKTVRPVAYAGFDEGYIEALNLSWADSERGRGPTGMAIRTGQIGMCRNMLTDPLFAPWREQALQRGYASSLVLPLLNAGRAFGAINIYSRQADPFTEDEVKLHAELANDLAHGIMAIRLRRAHAQAQEALAQERARFQAIAMHTPDHIMVQDRDLRYLFVVNPQMGLTERDMLGKTDYDLVSQEDAERLTRLKRQVLETGKAVHMEAPLASVSGEQQYFSGTYVPRFNAAGQSDGLIGYFQNVTERKRMEEALKFLVHCGSPHTGEDFFRALAGYLGQSLGMDFVCIDRLEDDLLAATTLAMWCDGKFDDNVSYSLKDTPCGEVVGKSICSFANGVRHLFPRDQVLQDLAAESYLGTTLWSAQGRPIGLIAVIGRKPLADTALAASILQLVAVRAAGELERRRAEEALRLANVQLERRVAERTEQLAVINADLREQMDAYHRLEGEIARLVEGERLHLGMELHDNLCQQLAATGMLTATLVKRLREQDAGLAHTADRIAESLSSAGADAQALARGLLPVQVEADGLMVALAGLVRRTQEMQGVACVFECAAPVPMASNATATHLYRIAQEALHNAFKHGKAKHIVVTLTDQDGVALTIYDDGVGIPPDSGRAAGSGLRLMAYRARMIGATLTVERAPTGGTLVRCALKQGANES